MNNEADGQLQRQGVLMSNIFENKGANNEKLSLYNEQYPPLSDNVPLFQESLNEDDSRLPNADRLFLLRNLRFIKDKQAYLFDACKIGESDKKKQFEYGNTSMIDFKLSLRSDFEKFKTHKEE